MPRDRRVSRSRPAYIGLKPFGFSLPVMPLEPPPTPERRAVPRHRTLQRGRVCYGASHAMSFDCTIRNLTQVGALLRAPAGQAFPDSFTLLHVGEGVAYEARLSWRRADQAGVELLSRHDLTRPEVDEPYKALRRIWVALAPS